MLKKIHIPTEPTFTFCESDYELDLETGDCSLVDSVVEDGLSLEDAIDAIERYGMTREGHTTWYSATDDGADTYGYHPETPTEYSLHPSDLSGIELLDTVVAEDGATILATCASWGTHLQIRQWAEGDDRDVLFFLQRDDRFVRLFRDDYDTHCTEDCEDPRITIVHTDDCFDPPMVAASGSIESIYDRWEEWPDMLVTPWDELDDEDREAAEAGELGTITSNGIVSSWGCFEPDAGQIAILVAPRGAVFEYDREGNVTIEDAVVFQP